jgi:hypothetical protein
MEEGRGIQRTTGLNEVRNKAGIATPQIFIRKKYQSRIRCSRVVKASYHLISRNWQGGYEFACFGCSEAPFVEESAIQSFSQG